MNATLAALTRTGGLEPRAVQPSPALVAAREAAEKLVMQWDDRAADSIAAMNLFLDRDKPHRRADLNDLHQKVGVCRARGRFDHVENALRGDWTMDCDQGTVTVAITLAPTMPPDEDVALLAALLGGVAGAASFTVTVDVADAPNAQPYMAPVKGLITEWYSKINTILFGNAGRAGGGGGSRARRARWLRPLFFLWWARD